MNTKGLRTHAEVESALDAQILVHTDERDQLKAKQTAEHIGLVEKHQRERADAIKAKAAWRADRIAALVGDLDCVECDGLARVEGERCRACKGAGASKLYPVLRAFGSNPRKDAAAIASLWRALDTRAREELNERPHQWHLLFGLSARDARTGHPSFFSCESNAGACARAERLTQRIVDGAGDLEVMQALIDLGATVERELLAIPSHHVTAQTSARAHAARNAIAFNDVLRAVRAVDDRANAASDEQSAKPPSLLARILR